MGGFTRHYLPCMHGLLTGSWEFLLTSVVLCVSARVKLLISFTLVAFNFLLCLHVVIWVLQSEMTFNWYSDIVAIENVQRRFTKR